MVDMRISQTNSRSKCASRLVHQQEASFTVMLCPFHVPIRHKSVLNLFRHDPAKLHAHGGQSLVDMAYGILKSAFSE